MRKLVPPLAALFLAFAPALKAIPVTVQDIGIGAHEVVSINSSTLGNNLNVYAGIVELLVNGTPTEGFCIDPWHWSITGPRSYDLRPLTGAPKSPGPMNASTALKIEQLWQQFYSPGMSDANAAGLQIAIWELVGASVGLSSFSLNQSADYGAAAMIGWVNNNPGAPSADLEAVVSLAQDSCGNSIGQDYVIPRVPDSGITVVLLGAALLGLAGIRRRMAS